MNVIVLGYTAELFFLKLNALPKFAILVPAMNEESSISRVLEDIRIHYDCTIVVIDDGSHDHTANIAKEAGAVVIPHVVNMGAWRATQTGIRWALKNGYDRVVTIDADGQHKAAYIGTLIEKSREDIDLVIGSCMSRGSAGRHIAWRLFKKLTRISVGDLTSGFRCYSKAAMEVLASKQATMFEYQDVGVLLMMRHLHMSCEEVSVEMDRRQDGISRIFHSWFAVFEYLLYTFILSVTKVLPMKPSKYHKKLTSRGSLD